MGKEVGGGSILGKGRHGIHHVHRQVVNKVGRGGVLDGEVKVKEHVLLVEWKAVQVQLPLEHTVVEIGGHQHQWSLPFLNGAPDTDLADFTRLVSLL